MYRPILSLRRGLIWLKENLFGSLDLERKCALSAIAWGLWVMLFRSFGSSPGFYYFVAIPQALGLPGSAEEWWGTLMVCAGSLQLYGALTGKSRPRMAAAIFGCTVWIALGVTFALYNPASTSSPIYGVFAFANGALYYQIGTRRRL